FDTLHVAPDGSVLLFALGLCILTALVTGLYPAWHASRTDTSAGLKGASLYGLRGTFLRRTLIVLQVTLAVVLLFGAALSTHSLARLRTVNLRYDMHRVLTVNIAPRGPLKRTRPEVTPPVFDDLLARVRTLPGIDSAAFSEPAMLSGASMTSDVKITNSSGEV